MGHLLAGEGGSVRGWETLASEQTEGPPVIEAYDRGWFPDKN